MLFACSQREIQMQKGMGKKNLLQNSSKPILGHPYIQARLLHVIQREYGYCQAYFQTEMDVGLKSKKINK